MLFARLKVVAAAVALVGSIGSIPAASAQQSETYPYDIGDDTVAVTFHWGSDVPGNGYAITWHYSDGSQHTQPNVNHFHFWEMRERVKKGHEVTSPV